MNRFHRRIARLEKIEQSRPPAPCPECGAPKGYVAGMQVRDATGKSLQEHCPRCGVAVNLGKAISPVGPGGYVNVIVLPAGSDPLPV